jgi:hypothetical protein
MSGSPCSGGSCAHAYCAVDQPAELDQRGALGREGYTSERTDVLRHAVPSVPHGVELADGLTRGRSPMMPVWLMH